MGLIVKIAGQESCGQVEWRETTVTANFLNNNQANVDIENITLVNADARLVIDYYMEGLVGGCGLTEGMPFDMILSECGNTLNIFQGVIDFTDGFEIVHETKVKVKVILRDGLNSLENRISGLTFGVLEEKGVITASDYTDLNFVVEKDNNAAELIIMSVIIFQMGKELAENIEALARAIAIATGDATGGALGSIGAAIYTSLELILRAAYVAAIVKILIDLGKEMIERFISPIRTHKCIKYYTALEKAFGYLGYTLVSPISEMQTYHYLSSAGFNQQEITSGIPNVNDYGYSVQEFVEICLTMFNAELNVVGKEVHLRTKSDPYWEQTSDYILADVLIEGKTFNFDDLYNTYLVSFQTDPNDRFTVENYRGTSYESTLEQKKSKDQNNVFIKGFVNREIKTALATRKDNLNFFESRVKDVAKVMDSLLSVFGKRKTLEKRVKSRVGMMKVGQIDHSVPKTVVIENGDIPLNHRDQLSAKYLRNKYHFFESFVQNDYIGQKEIYNNIEIPFGLSDLLKVLQNSRFSTGQGNKGRIRRLEWTFEETKAVVNFEIRKPWTTNLKETFIEP